MFDIMSGCGLSGTLCCNESIRSSELGFLPLGTDEKTAEPIFSYMFSCTLAVHLQIKRT